MITNGTYQVPTMQDPSTTQVKQLIKAMDGDFMPLKDIMALFHLSSPKRFRKNYLNPAIEDGDLERLYPKNPKHPKQKYRLTKDAIEWKRSLHQNQDN